MRQVLCILLLLGFLDAEAQNLVPNPSFEDTVQCSTGLVSDASGWENYSAYSPDYFHSCTGGGSFYVPNSWAGFQYPATGEAYCGMATFYPPAPNAREIIGRNLSTALSAGTVYFVSFKANLSLDSAIESSHASNKLGARFSTHPYSFTSPAPINNSAHVYTNNLITDTAGWTTVSGSFMADSSYTHISLGNFFDDNNTDTLGLMSTPTFSWCYYLIDDVCVSPDSITCYNFSVGIENNIPADNITIYPNPTDGYITITLEEASPVKVTVNNSLGQVVYSQSYTTGTRLELDLPAPAGLYFLRIEAVGKIITKKVVKK